MIPVFSLKKRNRNILELLSLLLLLLLLLSSSSLLSLSFRHNYAFYNFYIDVWKILVNYTNVFSVIFHLSLILSLQDLRVSTY